MTLLTSGRISVAASFGEKLALEVCLLTFLLVVIGKSDLVSQTLDRIGCLMSHLGS